MRSLILLMLIELVELNTVRYTLLPSLIEGNLQPVGEVVDLQQCSEKAVSEGRIAFRIERGTRDGTVLCSLLSGFTKFTRRTGFDVLDYILDTNLNDDLCQVGSERNGCPSGFAFKASFNKCVGVFPLVRKASSSPHQLLNSQCTSHSNSTLVTIENEAQNSEIIKMLPAKTGALIGLQIPQGKKWSANNFQWVDGSTSTYRRWASIEPGNQGGNEFFVGLLQAPTFIGTPGTWGDLDRFLFFYIVIKKSPPLIYLYRNNLLNMAAWFFLDMLTIGLFFQPVFIPQNDVICAKSCGLGTLFHPKAIYVSYFLFGVFTSNVCMALWLCFFYRYAQLTSTRMASFLGLTAPVSGVLGNVPIVGSVASGVLGGAEGAAGGVNLDIVQSLLKVIEGLLKSILGSLGGITSHVPAVGGVVGNVGSAASGIADQASSIGNVAGGVAKAVPSV
ncbi:hypothetical protein QR680_016090 [Steinernema hermaphroditum]|uniref:C-type lectin domain-containing protein n=1 Tax=Steinernema hermaphroditum TaxID=289476 RepID=A0AA39HA08_9BILA|nr:hypothetical protein QR680_016090 [Steinernema hermaphroditum]